MEPKEPKGLKKSFTGLAIVIVFLVALFGGAVADRLFGFKPLDALVARDGKSLQGGVIEQKILKEESIVINVAEDVSPSVVTVAIQTPRRRVLQFDPFGGGISSRIEG